MSLLSYNALVSEVHERGVITERDGTPISPDQINASSIDIRLGRVAMVECHRVGSTPAVVDYRAREPLSMVRTQIDWRDGIILYPGQFILTESEEVFHLPLHISAEYKLKSSMARVGLEHLTAGWADAGWNSSVLTLELKNMTQWHPIRLRPGDRIGQLTFFSHEKVPESRSYAARGRYNNDNSVSGVKE